MGFPKTRTLPSESDDYWHMGASSASACNRCLAVVIDSRTPLLQFVEAAAGEWGLLWVLDRDQFPPDFATHLLARLGRVVDITGLDRLDAARCISEYSPTGIMTLAEQNLELVSDLGTVLGLPVNPPVVARRLTNKYDQRLALEAAGVPGPRFRSVSSTADDEAREAVVAELACPVIVKPQRGLGSWHVYRANDSDRLREILTTNATSTEPMDLIVEELLSDGWDRDDHPYADIVSVESIVTDGSISHLALTGRATFQEPFIETGNFIPSNVSPGAAESLFGLAADALRALGVTTGAMHTELKLTPTGPHVIEVNGRIGGSIPELLALATDTEHVLLRAACRVALGEDVTFDGPLPCKRVGYSLRVPVPVSASRVTRIDGVDAVAQIEGVSYFELMRQVGDDVDWREGWDSCIYVAFGQAHDHDAMWAAREQITRTVQLEFT